MVWNLPGITMSLESFRDHGEKSKQRWKIPFFRILTVIPKWSWNDCNITVISGKFHPKKHYSQLYFTQKKKFRPTSQNGRFRDFET